MEKVGIVALSVTYNSSDNLKKAVVALLNQTVCVDRIVIVDNNSNEAHKEKLREISEMPENLRFSQLTKVCYATGEKTPSSHHAWFSVNYDMFTTENTDYHYMTTIDATGEEITLTYPDGMISWLSSFKSDYDGKPIDGMGNLDNISSTDNMIALMSLAEFFGTLFEAIISVFSF